MLLSWTKWKQLIALIYDTYCMTLAAQQQADRDHGFPCYDLLVKSSHSTTVGQTSRCRWMVAALYPRAWVQNLSSTCYTPVAVTPLLVVLGWWSWDSNDWRCGAAASRSMFCLLLASLELLLHTFSSVQLYQGAVTFQCVTMEQQTLEIQSDVRQLGTQPSGFSMFGEGPCSRGWPHVFSF